MFVAFGKMAIQLSCCHERVSNGRSESLFEAEIQPDGRPADSSVISRDDAL